MTKENRSGAKRWYALFFCITGFVLLFFTAACTPEEEIVTFDPGARLAFSRDTVFFDTLFSTVGSITQSFKVYNRNEKALQISSIALGKGKTSAYKVYVNGQQNSWFSHVQLLGGDSLLVLVEVFIDPQNKDLPFLVKDSLIFTTNQHEQDVKLISWGQDAYFLKALSIQQDTTFTGQRPYVILDSLHVGKNASLRIEKGARLFFNTGSSLLVEGSLQVTGTAEEKVLFRNERTDGPYQHGLGQWQGIFLNSHNKSSHIDHAVIRNAEVGLLLEGQDTDTIPDATISNTIIENMSLAGIAAFNADIDAFNVLVNNGAGNLVVNLGGGYYRYTHCTFANDGINISREPGLFMADTLSKGNSQPFHLTLTNNIIWGNRPDELAVITEKGSSVVEVTSNLIKTRQQDLATLNLLNEDPQFVSPFLYNYHLDSASIAIGRAAATYIRKDLEGNLRDSLPDLGAYEYIKK